MRVTILQPNYIPWRGYFDFLKQSDVFVVYDDVQYTKNDWRNRNLIKGPDGAQSLTFENFEQLMAKVAVVAASVGRKVTHRPAEIAKD